MDRLQQFISLEIEAARSKRNKMVFIVAKRVSEEELHRAIQHMGIPICNVGLFLSEQLRQIPPGKRPFEVGRMLRALIASHHKEVVFLERIEYLFDTELRQNPLRLFENVSGNKTVVIHWPGTSENGTLLYATPEHPEYFQSDNSYSSYTIEI